MKIGLEVLSLDSFARINLKSTYDGPLLNERMRANINKFQSHYVPYRGQKYKLTHSDSLLLEMKETLESEWGENIMTHILPHYQRPDIIYCFDEIGKSVTKELIPLWPGNHRGLILSKEFLLSKHSEFSSNIDKYRMIAVLIGGWNLYLRDTRKPTGHLRMKMEQLRMIGYTPILIHFDDWSNYSPKEKLNLLKDEMRHALK